MMRVELGPKCSKIVRILLSSDEGARRVRSFSTTTYLWNDSSLILLQAAWFATQAGKKVVEIPRVIRRSTMSPGPYPDEGSTTLSWCYVAARYSLESRPLWRSQVDLVVRLRNPRRYAVSGLLEIECDRALTL